MTERNIPQAIVDDITSHLAAIGRHFKSPKLTLLVRVDLGEGKDGDLLMSSDDLAAAIVAMQRRLDRASAGEAPPQVPE